MSCRKGQQTESLWSFQLQLPREAQSEGLWTAVDAIVSKVKTKIPDFIGVFARRYRAAYYMYRIYPCSNSSDAYYTYTIYL